MLDFFLYLLYRAGTGLLGFLPPALVFWLGEIGGLKAWLLSRKYRRLTFRNLTIAFGDEKSERELRRLTRRHFQRLGGNLLSSARLGSMSLEEMASRVSVENAEIVHEHLRAGRGLVVILSHLGNWEIFAQLFPHQFGYAPLGTIFQPLSNRHIDADVRRQRARTGVQLFDRREGFQGPIELLRAGGALGILADQHAGDHGLWTPFFGRLASTTPLPALLAKRARVAMISAAIYTEGRGRWRMVFSPRLDAPGDTISSLTAKANHAVAEQIRQAPEDWFWVHNRWKTPRPNFLLPKYKRGVYVPPRHHFETVPHSHPQHELVGRQRHQCRRRARDQARPSRRPLTIAAPAKIAPVWKLVPEVDEILALPSRSLAGTARLLRRQPAFDVAILFPNSLRSALEVWLARIPRRVGYRGHQRSWLLNQIVPEEKWRGPIRHQVHHYLHLAEAIGADLAALPATAPVARAATADSVVKIAPLPRR